MIEGIALAVIVLFLMVVVAAQVFGQVKPKCRHEWHDAGKVGYDGTRSLYCPICDSSKQMSETAAKIISNELMIRKLHDGSRKEHGPAVTFKKDEWVVVKHDNGRNCTYPIAWKWENERELSYLYSREKLSHSMYVRMTDLEKRKEKATGLPVYREGSRARVEFMEREARERKPDPLQAALARNKQSQDELTAAVQNLSDAVDRRIARAEAAREFQRRMDKLL